MFMCLFWLAWQNNPTVQLFYVWYVYLLLLTACYKPHFPVLRKSLIWEQDVNATSLPKCTETNVQKLTDNQCKQSINKIYTAMQSTVGFHIPLSAQTFIYFFFLLLEDLDIFSLVRSSEQTKNDDKLLFV